MLTVCLRCERQNQLRCSIATLGAPDSFHSSRPTRPKQRDTRKSEKASSRRYRRNDCTLEYTLGTVLRERQRWDTSPCHASLANHRIGHFSARCFDNAELLPQDLRNMGLLERNTLDSKSGQLFAFLDRRGENNGFDCFHAVAASSDHKCWCGHSGRR